MLPNRWSPLLQRVQHSPDIQVVQAEKRPSPRAWTNSLMKEQLSSFKKNSPITKSLISTRDDHYSLVSNIIVIIIIIEHNYGDWASIVVIITFM